jgi:hypothetical protein
MKPPTCIRLGGVQQTNSDFGPGLVSPTLTYIERKVNIGRWNIRAYVYHGRRQG